MAKRNTKYTMTCLALLVIGSVAAVFNFSGGTPKAQTTQALTLETKPEQVSEIRGYRTWTKVNPQPVPVSSVFVGALCRMPTADNQMHDSQKNENPHAEKLITVYVNELGRQAMMTELKPKFPVGSVIVKEKVSRMVRRTNTDEPDLLTVMIKRERGFNPVVGDWEFMAVNGAGTEIGARGKLESCQACHVLVKDNDFISRIYLPEEWRSKLR